MNNKIVQLMYNIFLENGFSVIKVNFRGVGKSDGVFDNGQGELSDAAAALDWIERQNLDYSQCWVSGFSFGSLICMQLIMRRPEVNNFIAVSPQPNVYDFSFLLLAQHQVKLFIVKMTSLLLRKYYRVG